MIKEAIISNWMCGTYVRTWNCGQCTLSSSLWTVDDGWIATTHTTIDPCDTSALYRPNATCPSPDVRLETAAHRYFNFVWEGKSLLEYCFDKAERSFSPFPLPPRAGSNVGRAAVVILYQLLIQPSVHCHSAIFLAKTTPTRVTYANVQYISARARLPRCE